jgi:hypothetical protein
LFVVVVVVGRVGGLVERDCSRELEWPCDVDLPVPIAVFLPVPIVDVVATNRPTILGNANYETEEALARKAPSKERQILVQEGWPHPRAAVGGAADQYNRPYRDCLV